MKILYVGHTYTVRANQAKISALARLDGVEIALVTPQVWRGPLYENKADAFDSSKAPNVQHHILRAAFIGKESAYFFGPSIFSIVKKFQPDIVHVEQGAYAFSYAQILWALLRYAPNARALFFTWWNLPYTLRGVKRRAERFNLEHSSCAIAGNAKAKDVLRDRGFLRPVHVLPQLGIDLPASPFPFHSNGVFRIGYAGRIAEEKGVHDLVHAVSQMQTRVGTEVYFVGAGDALDEVIRRTSEHSISFRHHPAVRNEELSEHFAAMDVLVLPSRTTAQWVEQFGHILIEAMAAGVPVIGSSSGEIPNVIGNAGIIFSEGNAGELAYALDRLHSNPQECRSLAELGRTRVSEYFTHDKIARAQKDIYDWMLAEGMTVASLHQGWLS